MNKIILIGRLTRDPEMRFTPANGVPVTTFTLAVDRPYLNQRGEREADFIRIVTWRKLAETCGNHLKKGMLTAISGRLQIRSYDGQDGQRRYMTEVVADEMQFLEKKQTNQSGPDYDSIDSDFGLDDFDQTEGDGVPF